MRRLVVLTVVVMLGVLAWARYKGRWAALAESATGVFPNGMAYALSLIHI